MLNVSQLAFNAIVLCEVICTAAEQNNSKGSRLGDSDDLLGARH